ncbi:electron transfer flavoprotein subunit alpha/FixB family protein [Candidatus Paracaedibacter symbiosus]|uniref:electron transfer flavoprotein subunit alpha/FixB family protein n=1 Tax=Candidatus Paracaedibacter symbiosus TaxID=244582 RepID=UPI0005095D38|nr:FAD-binding protein [Candidatus Paracaedibacter symbiosus]
MRVLIIAEQDGQSVKVATLHTITAGLAISTDLDVVICGHNIDSLASNIAQTKGVKKVIQIDGLALSHQIAEAYEKAILTIASEYTHILAPATTFGKNLLPRIAAKLDVMQISDVIKVASPTVFERPIYAGNVLMTVESQDKQQVMTVRPTAFDKADMGGSANIEKRAFTDKITTSSFIKLEESKSERPELASARIVVSGGRGVGSKENFHIIDELADSLGAAVGASRAAVDAGYVPNDYQVGQTGKVVAPELYIAVGISGAIQHLAGMKESKTIIAINKDPDAPIFQIADYGFVGDLFEVVPQLTQSFKK